MKVTKDLISLAVEKNNGFFAFSEKQFYKQYKKNLKPYVSLGAGLYAPKSTYKQLKIDIENASNNAIEKDIKKNGIDKIIWRELQNHEEQYADGSDTIDKLKSYGITAEQIKPVYNKYMDYCIDNDLI
tara:strand:- start:16 stop:399 length:384 start_codon:yes stop_codon:yes gene_type:complete